MWFFREIILAFEESIALCIVLPISLIFLIGGSILGYFLKNKQLFLSVAIAVFGCAKLAIYATSMQASGEEVCLALLLFFIGICYAVVIGLEMLRQKREIRRKNRAQILRKLQFTLPEKENRYVKDRLNTALRTAKEVDKKEKVGLLEEGEKNEIVRLEHVRKLLVRIKDAPLTKAERMEAEEMSRMFSAYMRKEKWTSGDVRIMNELFAALLKIAAKYAV